MANRKLTCFCHCHLIQKIQPFYIIPSLSELSFLVALENCQNDIILSTFTLHELFLLFPRTSLFHHACLSEKHRLAKTFLLTTSTCTSSPFFFFFSVPTEPNSRSYNSLHIQHSLCQCKNLKHMSTNIWREFGNFNMCYFA